jgi:hypothetical protein
MPDPVIDVGDERQVKQQKQKKRNARDQELEDLRSILKTSGGRAFLWRLLAESKYNSHGFIEGGFAQFVQGQRSIGGWVMEEVFTADPNSYTLMRVEAEDRSKRFGKIEKVEDARSSE